MDFNNADRFGRVRLNCQGTMADLEKHQIQLEEQARLILCMEDLECEGIAIYSAEEGLWVAQIDWKELGK